MKAPTLIETSRLLLRRYRMSDVDDVRRYMDDEEFARFKIEYRLPFTLKDAERFVGAMIYFATNDDEPYFNVAIEYQGKVIGDVELRGIPWPKHDLIPGSGDQPPSIAEMGWDVARDHWREGFATEAASAVMEYAFGALRLEKVCAWAHEDHVGSRAVMAKLGMRQEGVLRHEYRSPGTFGNVARYGILRGEWSGAAPR